jgi:putative spermidine/putrescine transport system permease protein
MPYVLVVAAFLLAPTAIVIVLSFSSNAILFFPPSGFGVHWYGNFFHDPTWRDSAITSLKVAVLSTLLATVLGTLTALGLVRGRFIGRSLITAVILSPLIAPTVIVGLGMYIMYLRVHLVGTLLAFVAAHAALGMPFVVVNVAANLRTVDRNLELAARNLGAGSLQTFLRITLPLILPGVLAGALFSFITSWDEVVVALFLSTAVLQTLPVTMWTGVQYGVDPTVAAASTIVTGVSLMLLIAFTALRWRTTTRRAVAV